LMPLWRSCTKRAFPSIKRCKASCAESIFSPTY
jgi:hypothetical protein